MATEGTQEKTLGEYSVLTTVSCDSSIVRPTVDANNFELKPSLIQLKGSLQIKKRNLEAKQSKAPCICVDACCSYPNPRLSQPTTLRRGNLLDQSHAYASKPTHMRG
ncbi:hypothetical protein PIB30_097187 [Stylosanthes scabra]|uniref:Uncharacterized protein n=1 Tax=Stylosanthes scabra TaxID=79078 RepID=A0ABU6ZV06_9FABA|nr:hypothetical protein [Stylosanthes scabra]